MTEKGLLFTTFPSCWAMNNSMHLTSMRPIRFILIASVTIILQSCANSTLLLSHYAAVRQHNCKQGVALNTFLR